jgi:thymidylate synthase
MELELAIPAKNLKVVNPAGTVALCAMWTPVDHLMRLLGERAPQVLAPEGPVALVGGLYGGGLSVMLRNLHHNPQIDTVVVCGKDFSGASVHLANFFLGRIDRPGLRQLYRLDDGTLVDLEKVSLPGPRSAYVMDGLLMPASFERKPKVVDLTAADGRLPERLAGFIGGYAPGPAAISRPDPVPLPRPVVNTFPSDPFAHMVAAETIPEAWTELLVLLSRFGRKVTLRGGKERLELLTVKAVVRKPGELDPAALARLDLSKEALEEYQRALIDPELREGLSYTYGHRLRSYFGFDLLEAAAADLAKIGDRRHAYASLWDNARDIEGGDAPCLVTVFFRKIDGQVHLSAVFRSHNASRAWPVNCVGLYGLMETVCREANRHPDRTEPLDLIPGTLTVTSMSISLDPADLGQVGGLIEERLSRPYALKSDPNGFFRVSVDLEAKELVVHHHGPDSELLAEYRAKTPGEMGWQLQRAKAISDIGHAMYMGSQLERAWHCLRRGLDYVQDKASLPG